MTRRFWLRAGMWFFVLAKGVVGGVQLFAPRTFYDDFPTRSHSWVAWVPPYSEHLMRDVGALNLALAVIGAVAVVAMDRRMIMATMAGYLVFSVPHLVFHTTHLDRFPRTDAILQTAVLGVGVLLPVILLVLAGGLGASGTDRVEAGEPAQNALGNRRF